MFGAPKDYIALTKNGDLYEYSILLGLGADAPPAKLGGHMWSSASLAEAKQAFYKCYRFKL